MRLVPLAEQESGAHNGTSTSTSSKKIIFEKIIKVKRKSTKSFRLSEVFMEKSIAGKKIRIS